MQAIQQMKSERLGAESAAVSLEGAVTLKRVDRRTLDRRGTRIPVIRFGGERRQDEDRRQRARRGFDRRPLNLQVRLRHKGVDSLCICEDLNVLGTSLRRAPPLTEGSLVRLSFDLPDDLWEFPLVSWAQYRSGGDEFAESAGFRFVGLRACDARRIGRLLAHAAALNELGQVSLAS